jgi:hypothetical protein
MFIILLPQKNSLELYYSGVAILLPLSYMAEVSHYTTWPIAILLQKQEGTARAESPLLLICRTLSKGSSKLSARFEPYELKSI